MDRSVRSHTTSVRDSRAAFFPSILEALPGPALLLDEGGRILASSDDVPEQRRATFVHWSSARPAADDPLDARRGRTDRISPLCERLPELLSHLQGPPWPLRQAADVSRTLADGSVLGERLVMRKTDWGACLVVLAWGNEPQPPAADTQTLRLAALGFMVAGVCHEISNPLTSLHSVVQLLRAVREPSPDLLRKGFDNISGSVRKILDITRRLVTFSRVGDEPRAYLPIDVAIEEAIQTLRQEDLLDDIDLHRIADAAAGVHGNTGQIAEVFLNLLLNAVQAMPSGGRLDIHTVADEDSVRVLITDSGSGIAESVRPRIFEPFFTTKAASHGTGLGLAISREIVLEHQGTLTVEPADRGARFCVRFARARA